MRKGGKEKKNTKIKGTKWKWKGWNANSNSWGKGKCKWKIRINPLLSFPLLFCWGRPPAQMNHSAFCMAMQKGRGGGEG
jgi:hypothetical protein